MVVGGFFGGFRSFHVLVLTAATCNKTGHKTVGQRKRSFFFAFDTDPLSSSHLASYKETLAKETPLRIIIVLFILL